MKEAASAWTAMAEEPVHSAWNPLHWPLWAKITAVVAIVGVGVGVGVGVYEKEKADSYPDYSYINYTLVDTYAGTDFFDNFAYYTAADPTDGDVIYVDSTVADSTQYNLTYASSTSAVLRVDDTTQNAVDGRYSVRITSSDTFYSGLFVFDVIHTPYGCATWPALWLTDPDDWPGHGEIDVMEQVNQATDGNYVTLHTTDHCDMASVKRKETGTVLETNCWNETDDNSGCGVQGTDSSFGEAFNDNGGGIYAMELRDAGIRVWMFPRDDIPTDLQNLNSSSNPNPVDWPEALADFPNTKCDISSHFQNLSIIVDITLCGDWAGETSVYNDEDGCPGTCDDYVATNYTAFTTAYWEFGGFYLFNGTS